jgi:LysM repeat protein
MAPLLRIPLLTALLGLNQFLSPSASAQDSVQAEIAALRKLVEQQNAKIDELTAQVAKLNARLDTRGEAPAAPVPAATEEAPPVPRVIADAPRVHIVVKGEALEKIAKQYGTTVAELQKLNNITDPKKLQIGQQLTLPPEKKEQH